MLMVSMPNAILIGASSGIGAALAVDLAGAGYSLGLVARRLELLDEVASQLSAPTLTRVIDISQPDEAMRRLSDLIEEMGDVDLFIICSGIGFMNPDLDWESENKTIRTNVIGFTAMANVAAQYLEARGSGHLVGISSIAAIRGSAYAPAYNASKAFVSNYLEGLRHRFAKKHLPITVTDIQPGFVDTVMAQGENLFWVASAPKASRQIYQAIKLRRSHAYITRRWRLIAWLIRIAPNWVYHRC